MGKKRASDDVDFVDLEREPKRTRKKPLELWEPPDFEPLPTAADAPNHGSPTPEILAVQDPYNLFKLFFTDQVIRYLCQATNRYQVVKDTGTKPKKRAWKPVQPPEMEAYLGVLIWRGVFPLRTLREL